MEFPKRTKEYEELKELTEPWGLVYGPVASRRLGTSLGINLLGSGPKVCSFDCPYCEIGPTSLKISQIKNEVKFPTLQEIDSAVRGGIVEATKRKIKLDSLSFVGNGEPTLHPLFLEAVTLVMKIRGDLAPDLQVVILSNGSNLGNNKVLRGLNLLDERMIKLDAGNDEMLEKINVPLGRVSLAKIINGTKKLKDVILQSCFVQGQIDNTTPHEVDEWIESVGLVKPKMVHLYSLDRVPTTAGLRQVPPQKLKEMAQLVQKRTGIKAIAFS